MRYAQADRVRRTVRGGRTGDVWTLAEEGVSGVALVTGTGPSVRRAP